MRASWLKKQHRHSANTAHNDVHLPLSAHSAAAHNDLLATLQGIGYQVQPTKNGDRIVKSADNITTTLLGAETGDKHRQALAIQIIQHADSAEVMLDYGTVSLDKGEMSTLARTDVKKFDSFPAAKTAIIAWAADNSSASRPGFAAAPATETPAPRTAPKPL